MDTPETLLAVVAQSARAVAEQTRERITPAERKTSEAVADAFAVFAAELERWASP